MNAGHQKTSNSEQALFSWLWTCREKTLWLNTNLAGNNAPKISRKNQVEASATEQKLRTHARKLVTFKTLKLLATDPKIWQHLIFCSLAPKVLIYHFKKLILSQIARWRHFTQFRLCQPLQDYDQITETNTIDCACTAFPARVFRIIIIQ